MLGLKMALRDRGDIGGMGFGGVELGNFGGLEGGEDLNKGGGKKD